MRINRIMAGAVASVLALGAVAPAFADNDHRDRREWREDRRDDRREYRHDVREARRDYERDRRDARRDWRHDHGYRPAPPPPRVVYRHGPGPGYGWQRGHRYRDYYRGPIYVVNDYPRYHLRRPPYGHHWIRDDRGNMLLVAVATGIIADYIINNR
ncbi:RcnB family protein [Stenotrophomonas sp. ZAC14D2_NAIMI4_6]|uniref:RcnB family protein n=1 Tax=Stenotrophomonas sp. ZAC14D2_NAIMI4_6 TaxID=2072406 RepID=UPI000D5407F7|nr:RcnB family protein [Stenotrophomonas sp. ZAC14D2_NAIMI4_6]AWH20305.1 hypothetical protein C1933_03140 [Stenotrophomonas sp. ZAC14D2_NAIMI4_6]